MKIFIEVVANNQRRSVSIMQIEQVVRLSESRCEIHLNASGFVLRPDEHYDEVMSKIAEAMK